MSELGDEVARLITAHLLCIFYFSINEAGLLEYFNGLAP